MTELLQIQLTPDDLTALDLIGDGRESREETIRRLIRDESERTGRDGQDKAMWLKVCSDNRLF
jgi:ribose 1,5-bisphosphokinase PhnN